MAGRHSCAWAASDVAGRVARAVERRTGAVSGDLEAIALLRSPDAAQRVALREAVRCRAGVVPNPILVMRGLDPRIHPSSEDSFEEDGWPGQARPRRVCVWY